MKKKIIAAALAVLLIASTFAACGQKLQTITADNGMEYAVVTDDEGNTVLNENGDIYVYVTDENGKIIENENGEPQTNIIDFPQMIITGQKIETPVFSWTLADGWTFDGYGKAVKDGSDGNVYINILTIDPDGSRNMNSLLAETLSTNQQQAEEIKKTYPDTTVTLDDVTFSSKKYEGKVLKFVVKDDSGKVIHYAEGIYFTVDSVIYKIEYAGVNSAYDESVDLYAMLQDFTIKKADKESAAEQTSGETAEQ